MNVRRPIEHLLGDLYLAELRLAWSRLRARRVPGADGAADVQRHMAGAEEARHRVWSEERRLKQGDDRVSDVERLRAVVNARHRIQAERGRDTCECWRCTEVRSIARELPPPAPGQQLTFKVLLGASNLEVAVTADASYLGAVDLDTHRRYEPAQLRAFAIRLGRLRALDEVARFQVARSAGGRG